jgi:hypothetical protein
VVEVFQCGGQQLGLELDALATLLVRKTQDD